MAEFQWILRPELRSFRMVRYRFVVTTEARSDTAATVTGSYWKTDVQWLPGRWDTPTPRGFGYIDDR